MVVIDSLTQKYPVIKTAIDRLMIIGLLRRLCCLAELVEALFSTHQMFRWNMNSLT